MSECEGKWSVVGVRNDMVCGVKYWVAVHFILSDFALPHKQVSERSHHVCIRKHSSLCCAVGAVEGESRGQREGEDQNGGEEGKEEREQLQTTPQGSKPSTYS